MALDQSHEQTNKEFKGNGDATGLTESPAELQKWMLAWLEIERLVSSMENKSPSFKHNEEAPGVQETFAKHVKYLVKTFADFGKSLLKQNNKLLTIDTKDVMESKVATSIYTVRELGAKQYEVYISEKILLIRRQSQILSQETICHSFTVLQQRPTKLT